MLTDLVVLTIVCEKDQMLMQRQRVSRRIERVFSEDYIKTGLKFALWRSMMIATKNFRLHAILTRVRLYGELVMFSHSLFALPFGLMGMLLAAGGLPQPRVFFWILIALLGARNAANAINRLIDVRYDAKNSRTAGRHLPRGLVTGFEVLGLSLLGFALLLLAAWQLNPLCLKLAPLAVLILVVYSYTKRWTWACHLILGFACGIAPTASWLAVTGSFALAPVVLTLAVMCWVAGFDIIYATQDVDFDRREGLHSIPARFGIKRALNIATGLHLMVIPLLSLVPSLLEPSGAVLGTVYYLGVAAVAVLLAWEHFLVKPDDLKRERVSLAAYTSNQVIGITILTFTILDVFFF